MELEHGNNPFLTCVHIKVGRSMNHVAMVIWGIDANVGWYGGPSYQFNLLEPSGLTHALSWMCHSYLNNRLLLDTPIIIMYVIGQNPDCDGKLYSYKPYFPWSVGPSLSRSIFLMAQLCPKGIAFYFIWACHKLHLHLFQTPHIIEPVYRIQASCLLNSSLNLLQSSLLWVPFKASSLPYHPVYG